MRFIKWIVVFLGVVAFATSVAALCRACDRRVVESECSEVYRRYKDRDNLSVAFVKDYRIGDSITVDVTTITAKDSVSWEQLLREMNVKEGTIETNHRLVREGLNPATTFLSLKGHPEIRRSVDTMSQFDLCFFAYREKCIFIFDVETETQSDVIANTKRKEHLTKKYIDNE